MADPFAIGLGIVGAAAAFRAVPLALRDKILGKMMGTAARGVHAVGTVGWEAGKFGAKQAWRKGPATAGMAGRAGLFAVRHPYATLGVAGAGAYAALGPAATPYSSPSLSGVEMGLNINQEVAAAEAMNTGIAPMGGITPGAVIRNQRLMESTVGLTQGLHKSRH
jgi:hypothetical protein